MRHLRFPEILMCAVVATAFIVNIVLGALGFTLNTIAAGVCGIGLAVMLFFTGRTIEMRDQTEYLRSLRNLR